MRREVGFFTSISSSGAGSDTLVLFVSIEEQRRIGQKAQVAQGVHGVVRAEQYLDFSQAEGGTNVRYGHSPSLGEGWMRH